MCEYTLHLSECGEDFFSGDILLFSASLRYPCLSFEKKRKRKDRAALFNAFYKEAAEAFLNYLKTDYEKAERERFEQNSDPKKRFFYRPAKISMDFSHKEQDGRLIISQTVRICRGRYKNARTEVAAWSMSHPVVIMCKKEVDKSTSDSV